MERRVENAVPDWKQDPNEFIQKIHPKNSSKKGPPELPLFTTNSLKAE